MGVLGGLRDMPNTPNLPLGGCQNEVIFVDKYYISQLRKNHFGSKLLVINNES